MLVGSREFANKWTRKGVPKEFEGSTLLVVLWLARYSLLTAS